MARYPLSDYTQGKSELLLMPDVSGTSFDGRNFPAGECGAGEG